MKRLGCIICGHGVAADPKDSAYLTAASSTSATLDAVAKFGFDTLIEQLCSEHRESFGKASADTQKRADKLGVLPRPS